MKTTKTLSRRSVLRGGVAASAALSMPAIWTSAARAATGQITVSDVGGQVSPVLRKAFYDPFEKETGIKVVSVSQNSDPVTQIKLLVDTKSYIWDISMTTQDHIARLTADKNYVDDLDLKVDAADYVDGSVKKNWFGFSVFGIAMAYNSKSLPGAAPKSWADYWNVKDFPGRRGFYRSPWGTLEMALLADGVKPEDLYPLDADRAFKKLDEIHQDISVWWTSGAQNTQVLENGEVDMCDTWSARAFAAIDAGAPLEVVWDGLYSMDGWSIANGTPRLEAAREFVNFCTRPEQQAIYSENIANGPSAKNAYDYIPKKRAALLPSSPENMKGLTLLDSAYWGKNYDALAERFNEWLLMG